MIKQVVLLIAASIASIFFKSQLVEGVHFLLYSHDHLAATLTGIFATDQTGRMIHDVIALLLIPIAIGGILSLVHYVVKKKPMPHTLTVMWVIWAVLVTALLAQAGVTPPPVH
jgi:FtsH-binding integral membrane protein